MKIPRLTAARLVELRFPAILVFFVVAIVVSERNISSLSDGISLQLFQSARLEEATRAELEASSLFGKAFRFVRGDKEMREGDVRLALDIFWSRIDVLATASYEDIFTDGKINNFQVVTEIRDALPQLESAVDQLRFGIPESYRAVADFSLKYQDRLIAFSDEAYVVRRKKSNATVESGQESLRRLKTLQTEYIGFVILAFIYVMFELYLSRKLNRNLGHSNEEKRRLLVSDHLTGIGSRSFFEEALANRKAGEEYNVVLFDLDGFKVVNDTLGHGAGDKLLVNVAGILRSTAGDCKIVARLGGDEFALLLPGSREAARVMAHRAIALISQPLFVDGKLVRVSASVGISHSNDLEAGASSAVLLRNADIALYAAKDSGKNCVMTLTPDMIADRARRLRLEADLKPAIEGRLVDLAFQPIIRLSDGSVSGFEALLRWVHHEFGTINSGAAVEIAERTGQILPLTLHVLQEALDLLKAPGQIPADAYISVNISPILLTMEDFGPAVVGLVRKEGIDPARLILELTEEAIMEESVVATGNLNLLKSEGIGFAVDDFGKGYSNLGRLTRMEIRTLKLDKSLIDDIAVSKRSLDIVRGICGMAADIGTTIVAEGVETAAQADILRGLDAPYAQGYYFARPMHRLSLPAYLEGRRKASEAVVPVARTAVS
jgi:diguanylate cyclase (GGDEF)-like protein